MIPSLAADWVDVLSKLVVIVGPIIGLVAWFRAKIRKQVIRWLVEGEGGLREQFGSANALGELGIQVAEDVRMIYERAAALIGTKEAYSLYRQWEAESAAKTRAGNPVANRPAAFEWFLRHKGVRI